MGFQLALYLGKKSLGQPQILMDRQEPKEFYQSKSPTVQAESKQINPSAPVTVCLPNS